MRADENVARGSFRFSPAWKQNAITGEETPQIDRRLEGGQIVDGKFIAHSLSGNERNQLFFNRQGKAFENLSLLSQFYPGYRVTWPGALTRAFISE